MGSSHALFRGFQVEFNLQLFPLWIMHNKMTKQAFPHGKSAVTASMVAAVGLQTKMELAYMMSQVEDGGKGLLTVLSGAGIDNRFGHMG